MAGRAGKWVLGCGIGCFVVLVVILGLVYGGYRVATKAVREVRDFGNSYQRLGDKFGKINDYVPPIDGSLDPDRIAVFLEVRGAIADQRLALAESLENLSKGETVGVDSPRDVVRMFTSGARFMPQIMRYVSDRAEAQIQAEMGQGEYIYIYVISYYSWLGKRPGDGPAFQLIGDDLDLGRNIRFGLGDRPRSAVVHERRHETVLRSVNGHFKVMQKNQLRSLQASESPQKDWTETLVEEIERLEEDKLRIPWSDGLPLQMIASLEPYRHQLEDSYDFWCNPLEAGIGFR